MYLKITNKQPGGGGWGGEAFPFKYTKVSTSEPQWGQASAERYEERRATVNSAEDYRKHDDLIHTYM